MSNYSRMKRITESKSTKERGSMRHRRYKYLRKDTHDFHHLLYQEKHWKQGWAQRLREHPYMGGYVPQSTLHAAIHSKIHDIPTPNSDVCKRTYIELIRREKAGLIDLKNDSILKRISFLIEMWKDCCPATTALLEWQRDIIAKFYQKAP